MDAKLNSDYLRFTSNGTNINVEIVATSARLNFSGTTSGSLVTLSNIKDPVLNQDAATKYYVDSMSGGSPGGTEGSVQYNSGSIFTGSLNFLFTSGTLYVSNITAGTLNVVTGSVSTLLSTSISAGSLNISGSSVVQGISSTVLNVTTITAGSLNVSGQTTLQEATISNLAATSGTISRLVISGTTPSTSVGTGALVVSGGVGISGEVYASAYNTVSDSTFKEHIKPLENSLDLVNKIEGVSYHWKNNIYGSKLQYGVIAQQLEEIGLNSVVSGSIDGEKSVNYIALIPFLIESIKELNRKITKN